MSVAPEVKIIFTVIQFVSLVCLEERSVIPSVVAMMISI